MIKRIRRKIKRLLQRIPALRKRRERQERIERDKKKGRAAARKKMGEQLRKAAFHEQAAKDFERAGDLDAARRHYNLRDEHLERAEFYHEKAIRRGKDAKSASDKAAELQRKIDGEQKHLKDLRRRLRRAVEAREKDFSVKGRICHSPGEPCWGGADALMDDIESFLLRRGLPLGSGKRTPAHNASIGGSPTSDHLTTKTTTDARDFPTYSGEDDARALAQALGINGWSPNSYASFTVNIDGYLFRVQILWGSGIGHGDHVHVGVAYLGRA